MKIEIFKFSNFQIRNFDTDIDADKIFKSEI